MKDPCLELHATTMTAAHMRNSSFFICYQVVSRSIKYNESYCPSGRKEILGREILTKLTHKNTIPVTHAGPTPLRIRARVNVWVNFGNL